MRPSGSQSRAVYVVLSFPTCAYDGLVTRVERLCSSSGSSKMNAIVALCHFCEAHGPCILFCTQVRGRDRHLVACGRPGLGVRLRVSVTPQLGRCYAAPLLCSLLFPFYLPSPPHPFTTTPPTSLPHSLPSPTPSPPLPIPLPTPSPPHSHHS